MSNIYNFYLPGSGETVSYYFENKYGQTISVNGYENIELVENLIRLSTFSPRFRIFSLNFDETINHQIPPEDIVLGGSYKENYQSGERRSLSITLVNDDGKYTPSANGEFWYGKKFLLEIGLQVDNESGIIIWFKKGVFVIKNAQPSETAEQKTISYELGDKFSIFEDKSGTIPTSYNIPVGTDIEDILIDILNYNNGNGYPLDPVNMIYHSSFRGKKTPKSISQSAGATWSSVISELAQFLSAEYFYNVNGHLTFVPTIETTQDGDKPVLFRYFKSRGDLINNDIDLQMSEVVNRVVVIGANVNGGVCQAIALNDNSSSPYCYQRIGYRTGSIINDTNIVSEILAQERADYELRKQTILKASISNSVYFNPLLEVNNLITITDDFYDFSQERLLLQSISFSLNYDGVMSISTTNINDLPFITR